MMLSKVSNFAPGTPDYKKEKVKANLNKIILKLNLNYLHPKMIHFFFFFNK